MWLLWTGKTADAGARASRAVVSAAKRARSRSASCRPATPSTASSTGRSRTRAPAQFDIDTMGPSGDGTLTAAELAVAKAMYAGTTQRDRASSATPARSSAPRPTGIPHFADNGGYGAVHRPLRLLRQHAAVRLAARHQLLDRLRRGQGGADAGHRGAEPRHHGASRTRGGKLIQYARLERLGRAAGRLGRLLLRADAVRAAAQSAEARGRPQIVDS